MKNPKVLFGLGATAEYFTRCRAKPQRISKIINSNVSIKLYTDTGEYLRSKTSWPIKLIAPSDLKPSRFRSGPKVLHY